MQQFSSLPMYDLIIFFNFMKRLFFILASWFLLLGQSYAISESQIREVSSPEGSILSSGG